MAVTLTVNAVDVTNRVQTSSRARYAIATGQRGVSNFTLLSKSGDTYKPAVGQQVIWSDGATPVYLGDIDKITNRPLLNGTGGHFWDCTCVSPEQRLDKLYVTRTFKNLSAGAIVKSIMETEAAGENITLGTVTDGATIPILVLDHARVTDVFNQLAQPNGFTFFVDTSAALFFGSFTSLPGPSLAQADILKKYTQIQTLVSRADYRNRQHVSVGGSGISPLIEVFEGDGATTAFTLSRDISEILSVKRTTSTRATQTGHFTGVPDNPSGYGLNYILLHNYPYFFADTVDNQVLYECRRAGTASACAAILAKAVNDTLSNKGTDYSWATIYNYYMDLVASGPDVTVRSRIPGSSSNGAYLLDSATPNFAWDGTSLEGGTDGVEQEEPFALIGGQPASVSLSDSFALYVWARVSSIMQANNGSNVTSWDGWSFWYQNSAPFTGSPAGFGDPTSISGDQFSQILAAAGVTDNTATTSADNFLAAYRQAFGIDVSSAAADPGWTYEGGSRVLSQVASGPVLGSDELLVVTYKPVGYLIVTCENSPQVTARAAIEAGSGLYENIAQRSDLTSFVEGFEAANALLLTYGNISETLTIATDKLGLLPGQKVSVASALLGISKDYMVRSVTGDFLGTRAYRSHFRYTVELVGTGSLLWSQKWLQFWEAMMNGGGSGSGISPFSASAVALGSGSPGGTKTGGGTGAPPTMKAPQFQLATFGLDDDTVATNAAGKYVNVEIDGWITTGTISLVGHPTTGDFIADVFYSTDGGLTWNSVFPPGNADTDPNVASYQSQKLVFGQVALVDVGTTPHNQYISNWQNSVGLKKGYLLRIDSQNSGGATGIDIDLIIGPRSALTSQGISAALDFSQPGASILPAVM